MGAGAGQRHVQGDDIRSQDFVQRQVIAPEALLQRRVVAQAPDADGLQQAGEAGADPAAAHQGRGRAAQRRPLPQGKEAQGAQHVLGYGTGIAAAGAEPGDAGGLQTGGVQVIDAAGGGADQAHPAALQQAGADPGDGAHQQQFAVPQLPRLGPRRLEQAHFPQAPENLRHPRDAPIRQDLQGAPSFSAGTRSWRLTPRASVTALATYMEE